MRKILAAFVLGTLLMGTAITNVSAAEYEVEKGDSLWSIAEDHDTTVEKLIEINDLRTTLIKPKQKLVINETYEVKNGDTLVDISKQYNVTPEELIEWNQLKTNIIIPGQTLYIYGPIIESTEQVSTKSEAKKVTPAQASTSSDEKPQGKSITVTATAYTAKCEGCSGITYTGVNLNENPNAKVIAVDPNVIPLGSKVYVEGYGQATAADTGGAIKGNKIDLHVPTKDEAYKWGVRTVKVTVLN